MNSQFISRHFNNDSDNGTFGVGFIDSTNPPANFPFQNANHYSCSLIISGSIQLSLTGSDNNSKNFTSGDVFQILPGEAGFQPDISKSDALLYHICLGSFTYQALSGASLLCPEQHFHITIESYLKNWMPALVEQLKNTPQSELSEVYLNTQKLLISLHKENVTHSNQKKILFTESAKQLLLDGCLSNVDFKQIASSLGVSYESFRKIFKEVTGQSPLQFVLENKFHYAQRFLTEGMSVKEAAAATGYTDPYIFSKQFKKYVGVSPKLYKPTS